MFCKVKNCRFADFHATAGHQCGKCFNFGHGNYECSTGEILENIDELVPEHMQCQIPYCQYREYHTTEGHFCKNCKKWGSTCVCSKNNVKCPICRVENDYSEIEKLKIYGIEQKCSVCMENEISISLPLCKHACLCSDCLKKISTERYNFNYDKKTDEIFLEATEKIGERNNVYLVYPVEEGDWYIKRVNDLVIGFFLHSDNRGQYGNDSNDLLRVELFLKNCSILTI